MAGDKAIMTFSADAFAGAGVAVARAVRGSSAAGETYSQVKDALELAYTSQSLVPQVGDVIELGDAELLYLVRPDEDATDTAIPGQSGDDIDRVKVTVDDVTRTAYLVNSGGVPGIRTFRGSITIADEPHPTAAEIEAAVSGAYGDSTPNIGDFVVIQSGGAAPFFARCIPQDPSNPNITLGLNYRNITVNTVERRFLISQTGTFI